VDACTAAPDATVAAVVFAVVGYFYKSSEKDLVAIAVLGRLVGQVEEVADAF